ncbi:MAG: MBL fold metallo-hydrolase [Planctomycetota bacterium]|nr:MBL fold metallo-hydrolase [Planctomycetota bacterium]
MSPSNGPTEDGPDASPLAVLLGTAQDGGYPQAGCEAKCCSHAASNEVSALYPSSIALCDPASGSRWIIDCTPAFPSQLSLLDKIFPGKNPGFILSHAHVGHYTGLVNLGNEIMGGRCVPVYVLPRMKTFLQNNEPWKELVDNENIELRPMSAGEPIELDGGVRITPRLVPHRDEHSETACFQADGPTASLLWMPDIDSWEELSPGIENLLAEVDRAFLDGTFFGPGELPGRDMSAISHPLILDSVERFSNLGAEVRRKVSFIHLNHTNPAIQPGSEELQAIEQAGCSVARQGDRIEL